MLVMYNYIYIISFLEFDIINESVHYEFLCGD